MTNIFDIPFDLFSFDDIIIAKLRQTCRYFRNLDYHNFVVDKTNIRHHIYLNNYIAISKNNYKMNQDEFVYAYNCNKSSICEYYYKVIRKKCSDKVIIDMMRCKNIFMINRMKDYIINNGILYRSILEINSTVVNNTINVNIIKSMGIPCQLFSGLIHKHTERMIIVKHLANICHDFNRYIKWETTNRFVDTRILEEFPDKFINAEMFIRMNKNRYPNNWVLPHGRSMVNFMYIDYIRDVNNMIKQKDISNTIFNDVVASFNPNVNAYAVAHKLEHQLNNISIETLCLILASSDSTFMKRYVHLLPKYDVNDYKYSIVNLKVKDIEYIINYVKFDTATAKILFDTITDFSLLIRLNKKYNLYYIDPMILNEPDDIISKELKYLFRLYKVARSIPSDRREIVCLLKQFLP